MRFSFHSNNFYFRLVIDFIDSMLRESASRAVVKEPPLSFREGKERWTEGIEKRAAFMQKSGGRQDAQRGAPTAAARGPPVRAAPAPAACQGVAQ